MNELFTFLLLFSFGVGFSQNVLLSDKSGYVFQQNNNYYKLSEAEKIFKKPEALQCVKKARANQTASMILGGIGGFGVGFGLASMLGGNNNTGTTTSNKGWGSGYLLIGVGFVGASIPFLTSVKKNVKKAVATENGEVDNLKSTSFNLGVSPNSIGLSYNF